MRTLRIFIAVGLGLMLFGGISSAQALVQKDFYWLLRTNDGVYPAVETMAVFTPSGNILHKQIFQVDTEDPIVPERGTNKISFITWVTYDGTRWEMVDVEGIVFPNGKVIIIFHSNGAGTTTPGKEKD